MAEIKLRPCPFCGGEARLGKRYGEKTQWSIVGCVDCFASGKQFVISTEYASDEMAAKAWNMREWCPSEQERWLSGED